MSLLAGTSVLEFGHALAGPLAAMHLADLGADVVKVEPPNGDFIRESGPFIGSMSTYFLAANRNKRSIAIDLTLPEGRVIVSRLARECDVVVQNFKPSTAQKLGIDYETLKTCNPQVVYLSISGYGLTGPKSSWAGFDQIAQGVSGLMSVTGVAEPTRAGIPVGDVLAGTLGALGVLSALVNRQRTGQGEHVSTSLLAGLVSNLGVVGQQYLSLGDVQGLAGNEHPVLYPYGLFDAEDGTVNIAVADDRMWKRLCDALDRPDLSADPRYGTNQQRVRHRAPLRQEINRSVGTRTRAFWTEQLNAAGIPCGPVNSLDEVFADAQVRSQGLVAEVVDAAEGALEVIGSPLAFRNADFDPVRSSAPALGEHTEEVLRSLGADDREIRELRAIGAIPDSG